MKILVLGADGYLGWPTSIDLALDKHELLLIDNYAKRFIMGENNRAPLILNNKIESKIKILKKINKKISFKNIDCSNFNKFSDAFKKFKPDAVIHFAELPSAPYSMLGAKEGWKTLQNNIQSTYNLVWNVKTHRPNCHIIKLGTMGEYGTPNINIEEGWLNIKHKGRNQKFLYPRQASSLYHTSKIMDTDLIWFYLRLYGLKATDLMQGPVYGVYTNDFAKENKLEPTFAYDDMFGTVLNRFIVQSVANIPLTVYGSGNQIRGYLNIRDTIECIKLALKNPPKNGVLNIFNQFTEQFSVKELADKIASALKKIELNVKIKSIKNPRIEKEKHYYNAKNSGMKKLGLKPTLLTDKVIIEMAQYVISNKKHINNKIINPKSTWK
jgi:UDP-sulfoquinovose synthase|tara:strand:- start:6393 stop:7538 length:1146 start_codon:yes stop_codon:yes gene_type:complete